MFNFIKRHKIASIVTINIIAFIIIVVAIIIHNAKTAVVDIFVAPSDATITLNGRSYDNFESHDILPGTYHVKISMENMQTKEYDITLENQGFIRIWDYLLDENGGYDYYLAHPEDESILTEIITDNDTAAKSFIKKYESIAGILDILPIVDKTPSENGNLYGVRYEYDILTIKDGRELENCSQAFCLYITDTSGNKKDYALSIISKLGYDPNDYQIIYEEVSYE